MLSKIVEVRGLGPLLPFVRAAYTEPQRNKWQDAERHRHDIEQHEGGEQGDPLMPQRVGGSQRRVATWRGTICTLGRHYSLSKVDRTWLIYNLLADKLRAQAGIQLHAGKTHTWNKNGVSPPDMEELGPDVWNDEGIKVLGTPVGPDMSVLSHTAERLEEEGRLREEIGSVPDVSAHGRLSCSVRGHGATISSGQRHTASHSVILWVMTRACREQWRPSLANSPVTRRSRRWRSALPHFRCDWAAWVSVLLFGWHPQHGPTPCRRSSNDCWT